MSAEELLRGYLLDYQRRWLEDRSRRKVWLKARQIGATDIGQGLDAVLEALEWPHDQLCVSYRLTAAKELLRDAARWLEVLNTAGVHAPYKHTATAITLSNGSRLLALAAGSVRSQRGTVRIDEAALLRRSEDFWAGVNPVVSSNPRYRVAMTSTPMGRSGLFYQACSGELRGWTQHRTDIYQAVGDGLVRDIEDLRLTSLAFEREFLCEWDAGGGWLQLDTLLHLDAEEPPPVSESEEPPGSILAVDLAKVADLTAAVHIIDSTPRHVASTYLMRAVNYRKQREVLGELADALGVGAIVLDSTKHPDFLDELIEDAKTRKWKVFGRVGTHSWKQRAFPLLKTQAERRAFTCDYDAAHRWDDGAGAWVPTRGRDLLTHLLALRQMLTPTGLVTYGAPRAVEIGHADAASALVIGLDHLAHGASAPLLPPRDERASKRKRSSPGLTF